MEAKSYEIQSEIANGGVHLAERSRGIFEWWFWAGRVWFG